MIPNTFKDYYGDETRWFIGKVLQVHGDPEELGRVKVRIYGVHPDSPQDCSLDELPWASVTLPTTEGGSSGFGGSYAPLSNVPRMLSAPGMFPSANARVAISHML